MKLSSFTFACALLLAPLSSAAAQDDIASKIINKPGSTVARGTKAKPRNDSRVQGGKAIRLTVGKAANPWDVALDAQIEKPIKAGDTLILAFWSRLEKGPGGATTTTLSNASVQVNSPPLSPIVKGEATVGPDWALHEIKGKADKDYAPGQAGVTIHLGDADRTIDFGPLFVVNMGQ